MAEIVFYDLFETILSADPDADLMDTMENIAEAYMRGAPPPRKTGPVDPPKQEEAKSEESQ